MHIHIPDICCWNSILIFASRGQREDMGGRILNQERGRVLLTCYSLYCTVDFTQKKPEWSLLCCTSFHRKSTNTQVTPDILYGYSGTANLWLLVIASCKPSWYLTTHATQMLLSGKLGHMQTSMSGTAAWYQIHTNLIIILSQLLLLLDVQNASGEYKTTILSPCFWQHKVPEEPAISPRLWLSSLTKSHPFLGWLYFPHLRTVCTQGSSLLTITVSYCLKVFGDHVWPSFISSGKIGDTVKYMEIRHPAARLQAKGHWLETKGQLREH